MSEDAAAAPIAARPHRRISAFHGWRRGRPFWGGLLLMLSGGEIFLAANEDLGSLHVQIGVTGFLSYIVPLFIILCGALVWATPSQRMLYGILAIAASIYSIVSVNLGGFLVGMLLGIVGGSLSVAWVPDKYAPLAIPAQRDDDTDDLDTSYLPVTSPDDFFARADDTDDKATDPPTEAPIEAPIDDATTSDVEGKQSARFPGFPGSDGVNHTRTSAAPSPLPRRSPRALGLALSVVLFGAIGFTAVHDATPAAAADCVPPTLTEIIKSATASPSSSTSGAAKSESAKKRSANGEAPVVPHAQSTDDPLSTILGGLGKLLGVSPSPSETPSTPADPSDPPSEAPTAPTVPTTPPTTAPTPGKSSSPSPSTSPRSSTSTAPAPEPSSSAPCAVTPHALGAESGIPLAGETPSTQTAATLTMSGLSYDGNYSLKTKSGSIEVMQFSMDSSTSTPFELDSTINGRTVRTKSSKLTVSGDVKFYATEIKGNVLGILPADYTPDNPPPLVPPVLFFTDVTIGLALVTCDSLSADGLSISN